MCFVLAAGMHGVLVLGSRALVRTRCCRGLPGDGRLQALPGRRFRASFLILMNEQIKSESRDLDGDQQVAVQG